MRNYKGTFNGYNGGAIDLVNTVSGSQVTGHVLVSDLQHIFEHEFHIAPNQMFSHGEPESVIRWRYSKFTCKLSVIAEAQAVINTLRSNHYKAYRERESVKISLVIIYNR
jgi:hypothetical protein